MPRVPLDIKCGTFIEFRAALISVARVREFMEAAEASLVNECGVHPGAVQRWRMGWLTEKFPEEEMRLFMALGVNPRDAAQNIARRIGPYSDARKKCDKVVNLLVLKHGITSGGGVINNWIIRHDDWSLVDDINNYTIEGTFGAEAAAAALAEELSPLSDAWTREIEDAFAKAEEESDQEMAKLLAEREAEKLKAKFLEELREKRKASGQKND
jgi:hypothetical protein